MSLATGATTCTRRRKACEISWKDDERNLAKSFEIKRQHNKSTHSFNFSPRRGHSPLPTRLLYLARRPHLAVLDELDAGFSRHPLCSPTMSFVSPVIVHCRALSSDTNPTRLLCRAHPAESSTSSGHQPHQMRMMTRTMMKKRYAPLLVLRSKHH